MRVVADIGGTNARFARFDPDRGISAIAHYRCADFPSLEDAVRYYATTQEITATALAVAIAAPVTGEVVSMSNGPWQVHCQQLAKSLGLQKLLLINDFTAQALAHGPVQTSRAKLIREGKETVRAPLLVYGPGTGLGVAAAIPTETGWLPLETEGGNVLLSPLNAVEDGILQALRKQQAAVIAEEVLSGRGVLNLYRHFATAADPQLEAPEQVTLADAQGLPAAMKAVDQFFAFLGQHVGDAALSLGCWQGVVLTGGIIPQLEKRLLNSPFLERLNNRGRYSELMRSIPVWVSSDADAGLRGAAMALDNSYLQHRVICR